MDKTTFLRLLSERDGLTMRLGKARAYYNAYHDEMAEEQSELLHRQIGHMEDYLNVLLLRIGLNVCREHYQSQWVSVEDDQPTSYRLSVVAPQLVACRFSPTAHAFYDKKGNKVDCDYYIQLPDPPEKKDKDK